MYLALFFIVVDFSKFNWLAIFDVISSTTTMKRNQLRCIRTEIIELALAKHSGGQLKYVGDAINGCDFVDNDGIRYECKSREKMFTTKNGLTKEIILKNFYRKSEPKLVKTFDHMIMLDTYNNTAGVIDYDNAVSNSVITDSIVTTKVYLDKISYVAEKVVSNNIINFEHTLNKLIYEHI
jgi:hypothetical protein